jgi:hypothetical protein
MHRLLFARTCFGLACFISCGAYVSAQTQADGTKAAARAVYSEIVKLPMHSICVRDFVDGEGKPFVLGQSVAASFSKILSEQRGPVTIASRARLRIIEDRYKWSGLDLADSAYAEKFSAEMGVEGFLQAQISETLGDYRATVTLRNSVGHELLQRSFSRKTTLTQKRFALFLRKNSARTRISRGRTAFKLRNARVVRTPPTPKAPAPLA